MNKNQEEEKEKTLIIWLNGKKCESTFEVKINPYINSLKRLKDVIITHLKYPRLYIDRAILYNYKGLEIDDVDIPYLIQNQILYISLDGSNFNILNYVYEFEFVHWIKSGGYGKVFLARSVLKKNYVVAVKKIDISSQSTDEIYNISREALYLQSFQHKNIIKYINSYIYDNHFYTIMDYAHGGELVNYLSDKKILSELDCKRVFKQIHDAVKYIHSRNVIHRDLKPNNILFLDEKFENVVLIDFGISGYNSGNIKETIKAWTTKFIPPELAAGLSYSSSPKFDVWALGVILYSMLFGQYPFDANKDSDIVNKIIKENHKFPSNIVISKSGYNLINGLLEKNADLRIGIVDQLFEDWYIATCSDKPVIKEEKKYLIEIEDLASPKNKYSNYNYGSNNGCGFGSAGKVNKAPMNSNKNIKHKNTASGIPGKNSNLFGSSSPIINNKNLISPKANSIAKSRNFQKSYSTNIINTVTFKKSPPKNYLTLKYLIDIKSEIISPKKQLFSKNIKISINTINKMQLPGDKV